jgi:hypothetical protein
LLNPTFIKIKFAGDLCATILAGNLRLNCQLEGPGETGRVLDMKKAILALVTAAVVGFTALAAPSRAEAYWRGGGWGAGLAGGLIAGALIGGIASSAYAYGPGYGGYGYYGGYAPAYYGGGYGGGYYGGYAPSYYGYAPGYYGGYTSTYYAPAYYPRVRRVIRPAYAYYGGPRYYGARYYGGGPRYYGGYRW